MRVSPAGPPSVPRTPRPAPHSAHACMQTLLLRTVSGARCCVARGSAHAPLVLVLLGSNRAAAAGGAGVWSSTVGRPRGTVGSAPAPAGGICELSPESRHLSAVGAI